MTHAGKQGWLIAEEIAKNDRARQQQSLHGVTPSVLELSTLAEDFDLEEDELLERLTRFRTEYFGADLSDSAIYYRLKKNARPAAACAEAGCDQRLPVSAPTHRRYCERHRNPAARTRRHRRSKGQTAIPG